MDSAPVVVATITIEAARELRRPEESAAAHFTDKLQYAYLFRDLEEAERARCGNERILLLEDAVQGSRRRG